MDGGGSWPRRRRDLWRKIGGAFEELRKRIDWPCIIQRGCLFRFGAIQQFLHACNQIVRVKRLSNQLVRFNFMGPLGELFVDYSGHQEDGRRAKEGMLLDVLA